VVRLVAAGRTNRQIAESLFLSPKTVGTHVNAAMRKLGVTSRTALAVAALTSGLVSPGLFIRSFA
jgi:DNA-binding NarL/FixJ family response regulator